MRFEELCAHLEQKYPIELADGWDQSHLGPQVYFSDSEVGKILLALDLTLETAQYAVAHGCRTIVTHHPFLFYPIEHLDFNDPRGKVISYLWEHRLNSYSLHTNFDKGPDGNADALAALIGGEVVFKGDYLRIVQRDFGTFGALLGELKALLGLKGLRYWGDQSAPVKRLAFIAGSGGREAWMDEAQHYGADCYMTSEIKLSAAIHAASSGLKIIDVSHGIERFGLVSLEKYLTAGGFDCIIHPGVADPMEYFGG